MRLRKKILYTFCFYFFTTLASAENEMRSIFEKPINKDELIIEKELKESSVVKDVVTFVNEQFELSEPLLLIIGGKEGPLYDPTSNEILIPYIFVQEVKNRFKDAKYSETGVSASDATMDAVMHTLFHELAHALIFKYKLPVLGKEEDAADALASVLLIEYFESGAEIAISAADLFYFESGDVEELVEEDFWDEHSLDAQRFYSTLCHVYGSAPEDYTSLKNEVGFSEERAELCIEEYENISKSWISLLAPYLKVTSNDAP